MDNFQDLVHVEHQNQRVLTTAQLAEFYGTSTANIKINFNNNRARFIEGKHFFKLEGIDLAEFKDKVNQLYFVEENRVNSVCLVQKGARILYLWTKRGAARHAKMLNTDKAWEVFEELEDCYFEQQTTSVQNDDTRALLLEIRSILLSVLDTVNSAPDMGKILSDMAESFKQIAQAERNIVDFERGKVLAKMIFALKDSSTKERIAVTATNLIVGEKVF